MSPVHEFRAFDDAFHVTQDYEVHRQAQDDALHDQTQDDYQPSERYEWCFATALKIGHNPKKRKQEPERDLTGYTRWIPFSHPSQLPFSDNGESFQDLSLVEAIENSSTSFTWKTDSSYFTSTRQAPTQSHLYECVLGDPAEAAIFKRSDLFVSGSEDASPEILTTILETRWINPDMMIEHIDNVGRGHLPGATPSTYTRTLRALAAAATAYKIMPSATIAASVFSRPLQDARWIPGITEARDDGDAHQEPAMAASSLIFGSSIDPRLVYKQPETTAEDTSQIQSDTKLTSRELTIYTLSREQTFACIAMFENRMSTSILVLYSSLWHFQPAILYI
jgi:hypothetical protein